MESKVTKFEKTTGGFSSTIKESTLGLPTQAKI